MNRLINTATSVKYKKFNLILLRRQSFLTNALKIDSEKLEKNYRTQISKWSSFASHSDSPRSVVGALSSVSLCIFTSLLTWVQFFLCVKVLNVTHVLGKHIFPIVTDECTMHMAINLL